MPLSIRCIVIPAAGIALAGVVAASAVIQAQVQPSPARAPSHSAASLGQSAGAPRLALAPAVTAPAATAVLKPRLTKNAITNGTLSNGSIEVMDGRDLLIQVTSSGVKVGKGTRADPRRDEQHVYSQPLRGGLPLLGVRPRGSD